MKDLDAAAFTDWSPPGIRAQLIDTKTMELVPDFVLEGDARSVHALNAVSPAFTASFPTARAIVDRIHGLRAGAGSAAE